MYEYVDNLNKSEKLFIIKELKLLAERDRPFVCAFLVIKIILNFFKLNINLYYKNK